MTTITKLRLGRNGDEAVIDDVDTAREAVRAHAAGIVDFALGQADRKSTFLVCETALIAQVAAFARAAVVLCSSWRASGGRARRSKHA